MKKIKDGYILIFSLILVFFVSYFTRLYIYFIPTLKEKDKYFLDGIPVIQNNDGYFFARLAKDFTDIDILRDFPSFMVYQFKPLISVVYGFLSDKLNVEIEWVAVFLDPLFASLFIFPFGLFLYRLGYKTASVIAPLVTAIAPIYLSRSYPNCIDTDTLILFFIFANAYFFLEAGLGFGRKKVIFLILAGINSFLFFWWYARFEFITLSFIGAFLFYIHNKDRTSLYTGFAALFLVWLSSSVISDGVIGLDIFNRFVLYFGFQTLEVETIFFPDVLKFISESSKVSVFNAGTLLLSSQQAFYLSFVGFLISIWRLRKYYLLLLPFIVFFVLVLKYQYIRLYMYIAPLLGIGLSFVFYTLVSLVKKYLKSKPMANVGYVFTGFLVLLSLPINTIITKTPVRYLDIKTFEDIKKLKEITDKNDLILGWWDWGYAIQYLSERRTFHDGGSQFGIKTILIGKMLISDEEISRPLLSLLYEQKTLKLYAKLYKNSPENAFSKIETKHIPVDTYILLTEDLLGKVDSISRFSKVKSGEVQGLFSIEGKKESLKRGIEDDVYYYVYDEDKKYRFLARRFIEVVDGRVVSDKILSSTSNIEVISVEREGRIYVYVYVCGEKSIKDILLFDLFFFPYKDRTYYKLVYWNFPYTVLYKVVN